MRTSCFVLRWCRYRSLSAPGVAAGLLLACLLTVIPLTGAFAASTRQATPPQQKNLDRAGVSVVRLLVTYTENVQQTSCTGLGALIRSWPSQSGSERNTWILTDGNLVNVSGTIPCVPTRTSARLTSIQIFLSSAYSDAQATISLTVPSQWKVDCQNGGDCSRGPALISFHSATLFPYLDIFATSAASSTPSSGASGKSSDVPLSTLVLKRTNTTGSSVDLPPFRVDEQQAVRFLTPALLPMPTEATNVKNGTPVVDEAGNLAGIYLSTSGTEPLLVREFDN
ncbi:MAG: hypothetical protein IMW89_10410, partial [Ktedonobacteraceae bacterium]|nr:hypothetical protein [Ktedonobacteraceae bacterium]